MTLLEMAFSLVLLAVLTLKVARVMNAATGVAQTGTSDVVLQDRAQVALQRIARSVMGSNRESLLPTAEDPLSSESIQFQVNLGLQDGELIWSDPEKIWLEEGSSSVLWASNPEQLDERRASWTNLAREYLEGELPNGMDDNGNGLIDEKGLAFVVDRNAVTIYLTLESVDSDGNPTTYTAKTTVTCRNLEPVE